MYSDRAQLLRMRGQLLTNRVDLHLALGAASEGRESMSQTIHVLRSAVAATLLIGCSAVASAQAQSETFTATASVKTAAGAEATAPVTIVVTRLTTDAERDTVVAALKAGGMAAAVKALKSKPNIGYIDVGKKRTPLKYAYQRPMSGGRLITVIASEPIAHLGAGLPDAKPKAGFDLALAALDVKDAGAGTGELAPAATIKVSDTGALQTQDYGAEAVHLTNVLAKK